MNTTNPIPTPPIIQHPNEALYSRKGPPVSLSMHLSLFSRNCIAKDTTKVRNHHSAPTFCGKCRHRISTLTRCDCSMYVLSSPTYRSPQMPLQSTHVLLLSSNPTPLSHTSTKRHRTYKTSAFSRHTPPFPSNSVVKACLCTAPDDAHMP